MDYETADCVVAGAGVVGLAIARALALAGREVIVLEANGQIGAETSSRNSEVIHAGIYYAPGSLKARFCIDGKPLLYAYLEERGLGFSRCGKILVATNDNESKRLEAIMENGAKIGCDDLTLLSRQEINTLEPALNAVAGVMSPSTGILDVHGLMQSYQGDMEACGGVIAFESPVTQIVPGDDGIEIITGGAHPTKLKAKSFVNSAGLHAIALANCTQGYPTELVPKQYYAKGNYFALQGKPPFSHLIYPVPEQAGLGVHLTLDLAGQARFGPDVEWVEEIDYDMDETRVDSFYPAIRRYWPDLEDGALHASYCGIRPKLQSPQEPPQDFRIQGPETHGATGLVNLFGIESPGLTGSLAIADYVVALLKEA